MDIRRFLAILRLLEMELMSVEKPEFTLDRLQWTTDRSAPFSKELETTMNPARTKINEKQSEKYRT
jgi:hypothetical protein